MRSFAIGMPRAVEMQLSILQDATLNYRPDPIEATRGGSDPAAIELPRYDAIREAVDRVLLQLGLDAARHGTKEWNPLGSFIRPGQKVFILCNFVYHRRVFESVEDFEGKCTHASVLRALIDHVLVATGRSGSVSFGNAPLQSCSFPQVLADAGAASFEDYYRSRGFDVVARDLRLFVTQRDLAGRVLSVDRRDDSDGVVVVLDEDSMLCPVDSVDVHYRVSDYEPDRIEAFHSNRRHRYVVSRHILESDVIVSLPKLKVHEKVGITCVVKGFVGAMAHKDSLAHHRRDSRREGGDEYDRRSLIQRTMSRFHDRLQRINTRSQSLAANVASVVDMTYRRVARRLGWIQFGAWHGNDTTWRMAVDLARIVHYARPDGTMSETPVRKHIALIDGVVGGEGDGPLAPRAVHSGLLIFSDSVALADFGAACAMGFDPAKLPIVASCFEPMRHPLSSRAELDGARCVMNGEERPIASLKGSFPYKYQPSTGWRGHL